MSLVKTYNISLEPECNEKWELIAKAGFRKKSDLLRKWINENWKEEYRKEVDGSNE
ncbi:hypothetical protein LCGC14_0801470 [marine sediment metagenome]|uniref:Ribbon-helix-helix protein CopG domain-containing protein n=1 Tax=marine sediment metagenome TaxID=412755 RepID=A0A0F9PU19_9ZZZZ